MPTTTVSARSDGPSLSVTVRSPARPVTACTPTPNLVADAVATVQVGQERAHHRPRRALHRNRTGSTMVTVAAGRSAPPRRSPRR